MSNFICTSFCYESTTRVHQSIIAASSDFTFPRDLDLVFISVASALCAVQIWLGFSKKVIRWFSVDNSMNIMS